ncbi:hypothetical protein CR513_41064, partial [Mucuna pruriens]
MLPSPETEQGIFQEIFLGKLDFQSEPWPSISDSAKDLIRKMLDKNPKTRLTAHDVLCDNYHDLYEYLHNYWKGVESCGTCVVSVSGHPWIVDGNIA